MAQRALLFENDELNHLDIEFNTQKSKSFTILDRVAREFDEDGSGAPPGDDSNDVLKATEATKVTGTSTEITAIMTPKDGLSPAVIEDNTDATSDEETAS